MPTIKKKFETFFNSKNKRIESVDILIFQESQHESLGEYLNHIFCPECQAAELTFVHSQRPHLRTIPSSTHLTGCSYNYDYARKETIKNYFDKLTPEQIKGKLASMMRLLLPESNESKYQKSKLTIDSNPLLFNEKENIPPLKTVKKQSEDKNYPAGLIKKYPGSSIFFMEM